MKHHDSARIDRTWVAFSLVFHFALLGNYDVCMTREKERSRGGIARGCCDRAVILDWLYDAYS